MMSDIYHLTGPVAGVNVHGYINGKYILNPNIKRKRRIKTIFNFSRYKRKNKVMIEARSI